ncbi:MAG: T9SS type A sorting domain-containing protein, partial [Paludibacter sp.]
MKKNFLLGGLLLLGSSLMAQKTIDDTFFDKVSFRGAFGTTDWTSGWANYDPQNKVYPATSLNVPAGNISTNTTLGSPLRNAASFADASLADPFFTQVDYVGAFGATDWTKGWSNFNPQSTTYPATTVSIAAGNISSNTTWTKNNVYLLNGFVFVNSGVTLTIEPGTVIRGDKASKATLIVSMGGKLIANGTLAEPIVFTSNQAAGSRASGDWGGVILLGKAHINPGTATIEGGVGTGLSAQYGGTDNNDNSGSLQYVRIEFPGVAYAQDNEINGLTMGGVGAGTTIENIQVSYSGDDSYEWFGGTVNCKHLIALAGVDDDFDTDFGYSGKVQFIVGLRHPMIDDQSASGTSNGFESDNNAAGDAVSPYTNAVFCNVSLFGPLVTPSTTISNHFGRAMHIRRNSKLQVFNSLFAGWNTGLYIDGNTTQANAINGELKIKNCILAGMKTANCSVPSGQTWDAAAETAWFNTPAFANKTLTNNTDALVNNPFTLTAPDFTVTPTYLLTGFTFINDGVTLTIQPGTIIRGDKATKATLIASMGAKLIANGTATDPIIFTSNQAIGTRASGDWGGVILLGKAPINPVTATIEGGVGTGLSAQYGGTDPNDNSGSLQYVRIEYPGVAYSQDNEINGLTFGGVGAGTTIDNIQVSYSGDDSYEWFGGTVNCKHLVAIGGVDDDYDTDFGYSGMIQYAVALRHPMIDDQSASGTSNGFESDNNAAGDAIAPYTSAVFSNFSLFGPLATPTTTISNHFGRAMHIRRNSKLQVYNSIFAGYKNGLYIDGNTTQANAVAGDLKVRNCVLAGMTTANFAVPASQTWSAANERDWYKTISFKNDTLVNNTDLKIVDPFTITAPNFMPTASSKMLAGSKWYFDTEVGLQYAAPMVFKAYANGSQVTATGSMVLVYKDGICLGSQAIRATSNDFRITVGSNLPTDTNLEIKLYDAATRTLYNLPTVVDFDSEGSFGTPTNPIRLDATASLAITLNKNSNWISFNVLPENNSVANVLHYTATDGDYIASQTESSFYYGGVWYGMETTGLFKNQMYVLNCKATTPGSIQILNQPLVKNAPITFNAGYNWFGYSLLNAYDVNVALAGINASTDDFVVTQATKGGTGWYLTSAWDTYAMNPGTGYIFKAAASSTFNFPTNNLLTSVKVKAANTVAAPKAWVSEIGQRYVMPVLAQVYNKDVLFQPAGLQLGVFKDGVCYGSSSLLNNTLNVTVGSDLETLSGLTYKVYDPTTSTTYDVEESVDFVSLNSVGTMSTPAALHIKAVSTSQELVSNNAFSVYPNNVETTFNVSLNATAFSTAVVVLYDMQGKFVKSLFNGEINGKKELTVQRGNLNNGLYLLKATVGDKQFTQKVVLK